jgi:hypothetical protein
MDITPSDYQPKLGGEDAAVSVDSGDAYSQQSTNQPVASGISGNESMAATSAAEPAAMPFVGTVQAWSTHDAEPVGAVVSAPVTQSQSTGMPPVSTLPSLPANGLSPVPVVRVLSPVGVEYVFLTFSLLAGALGLVSALISLVNGATDFSALSFPVSLLAVSVPVFAILFLHLKRLELAKPELRLDPSKRRSTQFTQIAAFVVSFLTLVGLVFSIFAKAGGNSPVSIGKACLDAACILVVAVGILFYYWRDEHKA